MFDFLSGTFSSIFSKLRGSHRLTPEIIESTLTQVQDALIQADVPFSIVQDFISAVKEDVQKKQTTGALKADEFLMRVVYEKLHQFLGGQTSTTPLVFDIPSTIMVIGLQGSGKTTTAAKLGAYLKAEAHKRGKTRKILLSSLDFNRPAAIDQLEILAKKADVDFFRASGSVTNAADQIKHMSTKNGYELVIVDTAGRLHVDQGLLNELKQVDAIIKPKYKLLILDAMAGQESLAVAQAFNQTLPLSGAIITKMDSSARGGVALAFRQTVKKPLLFIGTGEKIDELEPFIPERVASRIVDQGDILTLIEKANTKINQDEQKKLSHAFDKGKMTLQDFADQLDMMAKLGSLSSLIKYLPGAGSLSLSSDTIQKGESDLKKFRAIINSMTFKERTNPRILTPSRRNRIAKGAGVALSDVDTLLIKFEQSQQFVKLFKKGGNLFSR